MDTQRICPSCQKPLAADAPQGICPECLLKAGFGSSAAGTGDHGFTPLSVEAVARLFPQLEILELIGKGGMGAVYKARQPSLDRLVALKILPPRSGSDPGFAERFTREARALARLSHPNIVAVYDFGQVDGLNYFLMEYVDGLNLRQVEQAARLSSAEALRIIPQICEALQFAHDEGIVHRDIKPENVLLDKKGRAKIADFGLAKILGREPTHQRLTGARDVMGTPHYMAPEQVERPREVDHRADIYSLGVVFYEMLTGELPLGRFAAPSSKAQIDVRLDEVVLRALEKEPERRYQHVSEVKTDVEAIASKPGGPAPAPVSPTGAESARQQLKWPARGLLAAAIVNCVALPVVAVVVVTYFARAQFQSELPTWSRLGFLLGLVLPFILCTFTLYAALKLKRLESYNVAVAGSILSLLMAPGSLIGLPAGIWALVILIQPEIRQAFRKSPINTGGSKWVWWVSALAVITVGLSLLNLQRSKRSSDSVAIAFQKSFAKEVPIAGEVHPVETGGWAVSCVDTQTFRLFELPLDRFDHGVLTYQARLKSDDLAGRAYLEMWCLFPGRGEFFSRGFESAITGSTDWVTSQTHFFLKAGEQPQVVRLNLVIEGRGTIFIDDIQLTAVKN